MVNLKEDPIHSLFFFGTLIFPKNMNMNILQHAECDNQLSKLRKLSFAGLGKDQQQQGQAYSCMTKTFLVFMFSLSLKRFFSDCRIDPTKHFIWILSDASEAEGPYLDGSFQFYFQSNVSERFENHYKTLTPARDPQNPWLKVSGN